MPSGQITHQAVAKNKFNEYWRLFHLMLLSPQELNLNPHLSESQLLAVFPSVCLDTDCNHTVQYVVVDLNNLSIENLAEATSELNGLSKLYRPLARADGVVLLVRRST